ncbi:DUF2191 domain-containing protein [Actinoplanes sp. N902-109]|uniref:type II toxin-antitoxin system VapB family antitoxin n=1 Tax=Actinoplanes sp. (strain N902-109) TaxID=649831 RepID=UPI00032957F9|nr:DUF2191 domain-containing protein [Actinoplanes sp. N902-109]AGL15119.1 hypothetical protein L083_1609 [Actinoplanes sp. N902-109]
MSDSHIHLDAEALAVAATLFGTKTKKDTVNTALRVVAAPVQLCEQLLAIRALLVPVTSAHREGSS